MRRKEEAFRLRPRGLWSPNLPRGVVRDVMQELYERPTSSLETECGSFPPIRRRHRARKADDEAGTGVSQAGFRPLKWTGTKRPGAHGQARA